MENQGTAAITENRQNFVTIQFATKDQKELIEPLKIFKMIGDPYQVNTPVIDGYVLVDGPDQLQRIMTSQPQVLKLLYAPLGQVRVYHDRPDTKEDRLTLKNTRAADAAEPLHLPIIADHEYYLLTQHGIGSAITAPQSYLPIDITGTTSLISLTASEKEQLLTTEQPHEQSQPRIQVFAHGHADNQPVQLLAKTWQQLAHLLASDRYAQLSAAQQKQLIATAISFSQALQKLV